MPFPFKASRGVNVETRSMVPTPNCLLPLTPQTKTGPLAESKAVWYVRCRYIPPHFFPPLLRLLEWWWPFSIITKHGHCSYFAPKHKHMPHLRLRRGPQHH